MEKNCKICASQLPRWHKKYCSAECLKKALRENRRIRGEEKKIKNLEIRRINKLLKEEAIKKQREEVKKQRAIDKLKKVKKRRHKRGFPHGEFWCMG